MFVRLCNQANNESNKSNDWVSKRKNGNKGRVIVLFLLSKYRSYSVAESRARANSYPGNFWICQVFSCEFFINFQFPIFTITQPSVTLVCTGMTLLIAMGTSRAGDLPGVHPWASYVPASWELGHVQELRAGPAPGRSCPDISELRAAMGKGRQILPIFTNSQGATSCTSRSQFVYNLFTN